VLSYSSERTHPFPNNTKITDQSSPFLPFSHISTEISSELTLVASRLIA
jgi:hypothetical protein